MVGFVEHLTVKMRALPEIRRVEINERLVASELRKSTLDERRRVVAINADLPPLFRDRQDAARRRFAIEPIVEFPASGLTPTSDRPGGCDSGSACSVEVEKRETEFKGKARRAFGVNPRLPLSFVEVERNRSNRVDETLRLVQNRRPKRRDRVVEVV